MCTVPDTHAPACMFGGCLAQFPLDMNRTKIGFGCLDLTPQIYGHRAKASNAHAKGYGLGTSLAVKRCLGQLTDNELLTNTHKQAWNEVWYRPGARTNTKRTKGNGRQHDVGQVPPQKSPVAGCLGATTEDQGEHLSAAHTPRVTGWVPACPLTLFRPSTDKVHQPTQHNKKRAPWNGVGFRYQPHQTNIGK
jgi:hypothetical protein